MNLHILSVASVAQCNSQSKLFDPSLAGARYIVEENMNAMANESLKGQTGLKCFSKKESA